MGKDWRVESAAVAVRQSSGATAAQQCRNWSKEQRRARLLLIGSVGSPSGTALDTPHETGPAARRSRGKVDVERQVISATPHVRRTGREARARLARTGAGLALPTGGISCMR